MDQEYFNLYGMRFLVSGDVKAARERAQLARKLMFQAKMMNVNNLDIVQNNLRLDDGTQVYVQSQHGLDTAQIYVPPKVSGGKRYRERIKTTYYPAFEVYDGSSWAANMVGLVICRGGGFSPPYEFIEINQESPQVDDFDWGQWVYNYSEMPFDSLENYLAPNFLREKLISERKETLFEIPPTGTQNLVWIGNKEQENPSLTKTSDLTWDGYWCGSPGTGWTGLYGEQATKFWQGSLYREGSLSVDYGYFVPTDGNNNPLYSPDRYPSFIFWNDNDIEGGGYIIPDGLLPIDAGGYTWEASAQAVGDTNGMYDYMVYMTKWVYDNIILTGG